MFVASELCDVVRVEAHRLNGNSIYEALRQALNNKFVNKVTNCRFGLRCAPKALVILKCICIYYAI